MNGGGRSFFDQFIDDYFSESEEHLTSARNRMLAIESAGPNKPVDAAILDQLLRDFHSLKGLSAMVGLDDATQIAHQIEDYLRELKRPQAVISADGIERVNAGISAIEQVVEAKRKSAAPPDVSAVLLQLTSAAEELRTTPAGPAKVHTSTWRFTFRSSPELAEKGLNVSSVRDQLRGLGEIIRASPHVLGDGQLAFEFIVSTTAPESAFAALQARGIEYSRIEGGQLAAPLTSKDVPAEPSPVGVGVGVSPVSVIRVEMNRLDDLMRLVGELVISRSRLDELVRGGTQDSKNWNILQEINAGMERQLRELRAAVMRVRMVPIGQVFERMKFVVRGLERDLNKRVELQISGQATEIDKLVVERLMDPLLHLVRNALSHGLESPKERIAAGKSEIGLLRLSANTFGDTVVIEVEDDGRGIDTGQIATRARALDLMGEGETLDPKRVLDTISAPGFTTREQADLSSGRGVGMAAVQGSISELGGTMSLTTTGGKGTCFTLRVPITLLIADSLMVSVSHQRFAVPQTAVREVLAVDTAAVKTFENNEVLPFRGGVLPLVRVARVFGVDEVEQKRLHLLVIENAGTSTALAVDRITGQREIVVRTVTDPLVRVPGVVGATELGDGKPVLILDPHSLIRTAREQRAAKVAI
jgi:two-component system chemotaxis sensor kinase CheA